ncbi:C40 family peptidase [Iamia sp. SCSIO 61187]|uniref:C40 family peptidase n=1 Tax=Iamia sp. SCSIO 61187 TaxID=2722752 RepID=UPI001C62DDEB|nr:C40 family peptidase [Iamia sp. SCSIO 61187]QYG92072.1 C40 family peptidase [Iamia sp. SCSIO 61187]
MLARSRAVAATAVLAVLLAAASLAGCTPGQSAVDHARQQIGRPYTYGGSSPGTGFDCSGLTSYAWRQAGVTTMPRTSRDQHRWAERIGRDQLQPGDLVFYSSGGPGGTVSHVALYAGDGRIIHAPSSGQTVTEASLASWWTSNLVGFGRVPASALP